MTKNRQILTIVNLGVLLALGVILSIAERFIVFIPAVPGIKLGLANTIGIIVLLLYGRKQFLLIGLLRVLLAGTANGFGTTFLISLSGFVVSSLIVLLMTTTNKFSIFGLSMMSAVFHGIGQVIAVAFLYNNIYMFYYLFLLMFLGVPTGILVAFLAKMVLIRLKTRFKEQVYYE